MKLSEDLEGVRQRLDALEDGTETVIGDWIRLDARAARLMIAAQHQVAALQQEMIGFMRAEPSDPAWVTRQASLRGVRDMLEELHIIRMCVQSRIFELDAAAKQTGFTNRVA